MKIKATLPDCLREEIFNASINRCNHDNEVDNKEIIDREPEGFPLEGWDWRFYNEKVMGETFDINEEQLRPYFRLENVRDGIFYLAEKLYGISFSQVFDAPLPLQDATLRECRDAHGSHLGVINLDFFPLAGKRGGA